MKLRLALVGALALAAGVGAGVVVGASGFSTTDTHTTTTVETYTTPARTVTQKVAVVHVRTITQPPIVQTETITAKPAEEHREAEVHEGLTTYAAPDAREEQEEGERTRCAENPELKEGC
jgi:hypothetical protein